MSGWEEIKHFQKMKKIIVLKVSKNFKDRIFEYIHGNGLDLR